jgi:protein-L-isoaspartate(D-aspartate) O-methyltransferase
MPPAALGRLLNELAPRAGERALVVGAASGYCAALLEAIGLHVTSVDGLDLSAGEGDAFDLILIDGAVEHIPQPLIDRLVEGGRLAAGLRESGITRLIIGRAARGRLGVRAIVDADIPPLPIFTLPPAFTF